MSNSSSNVQNLNEGRVEEALHRVSERLGDILGEVGALPDDGTRRNESGELVNEEGLPIIDITEPIDELDTPSLSAATEEDEMIEEDNYPEPISKLSPEALAISRKHRDKILELLEDEETREEQRTRREQQAELEQKRETARNEMQKRMMTQGSDLNERRRAKEMEKRMAKALVSGLAEPEPTKSSKAVAQSQDKEKKSVKFADPPLLSESRKVLAQSKQPTETVAWGDVVPGRLPKKRGLPASSHTQPMKMEVIERVTLKPSLPAQQPSPPSEPPKIGDSASDSDDESESEASSESTTALESGDEDVVLSAHRHRELALEYHRRREALASSAGAIQPDDLGLGDNHATNWDTEEVPVEATLAHPPPKSSVSKFKESLPNRSDSPSESLDPAPSSTFGVSVLPPSALAKSVKMGKVVDGNLVAGDEDEDEKEREAREEEEIRKLLLKSMEDYSEIAVQVMGPAKSGSYWAKPEGEEAASSMSTLQPPVKPKPKPKASRFKVNRTHARGPSAPSVDASSSVPYGDGPASASASAPGVSTAGSAAVSPCSSTPLSEEGRSSPKLTPHRAPEAISSPPVGLSQSTTIESPSFAPLRSDFFSNVPTRHPFSLRPPSVSNSPASHSTIIDSPSFQAPQSTIIDSPSFMRNAESSVGPQAPERGSANVTSMNSVRAAERDNTVVMADDVRERSGDQAASVDGLSDRKPQRVSRFKAERLGN